MIVTVAPMAPNPAIIRKMTSGIMIGTPYERGEALQEGQGIAAHILPPTSGYVPSYGNTLPHRGLEPYRGWFQGQYIALPLWLFLRVSGEVYAGTVLYRLPDFARMIGAACAVLPV